MPIGSGLPSPRTHVWMPGQGYFSRPRCLSRAILGRCDPQECGHRLALDRRILRGRQRGSMLRQQTPLHALHRSKGRIASQSFALLLRCLRRSQQCTGRRFEGYVWKTTPELLHFQIVRPQMGSRQETQVFAANRTYDGQAFLRAGFRRAASRWRLRTGGHVCTSRSFHLPDGPQPFGLAGPWYW